MLRNNADARRCSPMLIFRAWATCGKMKLGYVTEIKAIAIKQRNPFLNRDVGASPGE